MSESFIPADEERRRLTLERQSEAASPDRSAWVSANAGTGKTRVLTDRVTRLLLDGAAPEKILCLTFTKTAAAEMANRLFERLGRWTALDDVSLLKELRALEGGDLDAERLGPARRLFARALETPGGLKIQTIHGFCQAVLERFPLEAGVAPGFDVLDDAGSRALLREADLALYQEAGEDGDLKEALERMAMRFDGPGFSDLMRRLLSKKREIARHAGDLEHFEKGLRERLGLQFAGSLEGGDDLLAAALDETLRLETDLREAAARLGEGTSTDKKRGLQILEFLAAPSRDTFGVYEDVYLTAAGSARARLMTKKPTEAFPDVAAFLLAEQERIVGLREQLKGFTALRVTLDVLRLGDRFIQHYEALKRRTGVLDYDDLIDRTAELGRQTSMAWVHYKLDGGIDHILVDEAQDTSPGQWQVIQALAEDFFSGDSAFDQQTKGPGRTIFAVGDEKQSIYSFQGADPEEFGKMRAFFAERVRGGGLKFSDLDLILSFRSTCEVLDAVDAVFADPAHAKGLTGSGTVPKHEADRASEPGLVELWPVALPPEKDDSDPWDAPLDTVSRAAPRAVTARQIAAQIEHWLETHEPVLPGGPPMKAGDILILVQRRNTFVDEMIRALKNRGIAVAGRDRMVLTDQIAVMDLMALADFALLPEDDLTLACVLRSPFVGLSEEALFTLAEGRAGSLWAALRGHNDEAMFGAALGFLSQVLARAYVLRPFEFFVEALGTSEWFVQSGRTRLLTRLGPEASDPVDEFLSHALGFERLHPPGLQSFLDSVRGDEAQIKRDFDHAPREVRIMTVHGAKGLEGRIVFLPDTCALPSARSDPPLVPFGEGLIYGLPKNEAPASLLEAREGLQEKRLAEQRRLLYVAMTRARDRLYITGYETKRARPEGCWYDLIETSLGPLMTPAVRHDGVSVLRLERGGDANSRSDETQFEDGAPGREDFVASSLPDFIHRPVFAEPPPRRFVPSQLDEALSAMSGADTASEKSVASPLAASGPDRFRRGNAVHKLLELLPQLPEGERAGAAQRWLDAPGRGFEDGAARAIAGEVMAVLQDSEFAAIFGPGSLGEAPIAGLLPGTDIHLNGSIDRLVVTQHEVLIVDFKTNRPPPREVSKLPHVYVLQMAAYRSLLGAALPGRTVRAALLWTDEARLMEIPPVLMDEALAQL